MGFEPTIPVLERAKSVHALDRATIVIGLLAFGKVFLFSLYTMLVPFRGEVLGPLPTVKLETQSRLSERAIQNIHT
jgi:hypothetical protein